MWKVDGTKIIIQLKFQSHGNAFEAISTTVFTWTIILNAPKNAKTRKKLKSPYIDL